jgi:hypothetical protein
LRLLQKIYDDIRAGRFHPDRTRSGRFLDPPEPPDFEVVVPMLSQVAVRPVRSSEAWYETDGSGSDDGFLPSASAVPVFDQAHEQELVDRLCIVCQVKQFNLFHLFCCVQCGGLMCNLCVGLVGGEDPFNTPCAVCSILVWAKLTESDDTSCSDDSCDSSDDDERDAVAACCVAANVYCEPQDVAAPFGFAQHIANSTLHIVADRSDNFDVDTPVRFNCGRFFSGQYLSHDVVPAFPYPRCMTCFRKHSVTESEHSDDGSNAL